MDQNKREQPKSENRTPRRYKIYDNLNISINAINIIIYVLIGLILLAVLAGMTVR
jgi:hypothetical protein